MLACSPGAGQWPWPWRAAPIVLLALFAGLSFQEMRDDSLTADERVHLPAGYSYWRTGDFRLNPEHPPLIKLLCALPLLPLDLTLPPLEPPSGTTPHVYQPAFGSAFLFDQSVGADRLLLRGRLPVLGLGLLLGIAIFAWSSRLHGDRRAGLLSLLLFALEPTILAHSHYVTTDVGVAVFATLAFYLLWRFRSAANLTHLMMATAAMGLTLAAKFSAVVLLPIFLGLIVLRWPDGAPTWRGSPIGGGRRLRLLALPAALLAVALIVQGSYFFSSDLSLYARGIRAVQANHPADYPAYLHGRFYIGGVFWYPLYAFLLKTPLPTLAIMALGIGRWIVRLRRRDEAARELLPFVVLPAAALTAATCLLADNYGVRYLIPVTALLLIPAGGALELLRRQPFGRAAGVGLGLWLLASVLGNAPHHLSYFNELIGRQERAAFYLHDSNVDWGQDLKRLARYQRAQGIDVMTLAYWGPTRPEHYGIRYRPWSRPEATADRPPPGVYAISVNHLVDLEKRVLLAGDDPNLDWLHRFRPQARVGGSIFVYRFPRETPGRSTTPGSPRNLPDRRPDR